MLARVRSQLRGAIHALVIVLTAGVVACASVPPHAAKRELITFTSGGFRPAMVALAPDYNRLANVSRMIPGGAVGPFVASGRAEIGFHQLSEVKGARGLTVVGLVPDELQKITTFSAGIVSNSRNKAQGRHLIDYLASDRVRKVGEASGLEPVQTRP